MWRKENAQPFGWAIIQRRDIRKTERLSGVMGDQVPDLMVFHTRVRTRSIFCGSGCST